MSKLQDRLRKDAPDFGLEKFDPTFDLRQEAADALDAAQKALRDARETITILINSRWAECEGPDDEWTGLIDAALARLEDK